MKKEHADKHLKGVISLAPIGHFEKLGGIAPVVSPFGNVIMKTLNTLGIYSIGDRPFFSKFVTTFCGTFPGILFCRAGLALGTGLSTEEEQPALLPVFFSYFPDGTSLRTLNHYAQCIYNGTLRMYDYGKTNNKLRYNSTEPPVYDLNRISIPTHFFGGEHDLLADPEDVSFLHQIFLRNGVPTSLSQFDYAHNDFYLARHVEDFYSRLLIVISELEKT
ncbi:hypothetical protein JTB14_018121 [Gonioctena quinquepunctata]|nr:hypothetical protein JTB14_018121 [Gonioctena quinquepunctata]